MRRTHGVSSSSPPPGASSRAAGTSGTGRYARLSASGSAPALDLNGSDEWPRRFTYSCHFDLSFSAGADSTDENLGLRHNRGEYHSSADLPHVFTVCLPLQTQVTYD